ncbi:MAG: hypothetical protein AAGJ35_13735, partial [Myxococcota bacterium]
MLRRFSQGVPLYLFELLQQGELLQRTMAQSVNTTLPPLTEQSMLFPELGALAQASISNRQQSNSSFAVNASEALSIAKSQKPSSQEHMESMKSPPVQHSTLPQGLYQALRSSVSESKSIPQGEEQAFEKMLWFEDELTRNRASTGGAERYNRTDEHTQGASLEPLAQSLVGHPEVLGSSAAEDVQQAADSVQDSLDMEKTFVMSRDLLMEALALPQTLTQQTELSIQGNKQAPVHPILLAGDKNKTVTSSPLSPSTRSSPHDTHSSGEGFQALLPLNQHRSDEETSLFSLTPE